MVRIPLIAVALLFGVAACGEGSDADDTDDVSAGGEQSSSTQQSADDAAPEATTAPDADDSSGDDSGDAEGAGPSTATVTIGDQTYDFSTEGALVAQCQTDLFGIFSVQLPMIDGGDGGIAIVILRDGTDPAVVEQNNEVRVSVGDEDWEAAEAGELFEMSEQLVPGMSQVDSAEVDGNTVRGTATFVRQLSLFAGGEVEIETGSFEATCGEERLS